MAKKQMSNMDIEQAAGQLLKQEIAKWEDATVYITDRVAFNMRDLIRTLRKNYWGIFDVPIDTTTGRKKIWAPLTETMCEAVVKNIDLDQKDIRFRAKKPTAYATAYLLRGALKDNLDKEQFGEELDISERALAVDGTVVWKTYEENGKMCRKTVDLLNFYIDPIAHNIQETPAVIERAVVPISELKGYDWLNVDLVQGDTNLHRTDPSLQNDGNTKLVDVYERWGLMPKYLITGNKDDTDLIEGRICASGITKAPIIHKIEKNTTKDKDGNIIKPYEEAWLRRVPGRWYGKGVAEQLLMLQSWLNTVINIRINRAYVAQLGIFKVKTGSGITPAMLSNLSANGAVRVTSMDDIEQLVMSEASASSYKDEEVITDWGQRVTNAYEIATGETLPADTKATNAVIQSRSAQSGFEIIKEGIGNFLIRWINRHVIPIIAKNIKVGDIIRLTDEDTLKQLSERIVAKIAMDELENMNAQGLVPDPMQLQMAMQNALNQVRSNPEMFVQVLEELLTDQVDAEVYVTNEKFDTAVMTQNLVNMMRFIPEYKDQIVKAVFDLMGLPPLIATQQMGMMGQPGIQPGQPPQQQLPQANTPQGVYQGANVSPMTANVNG